MSPFRLYWAGALFVLSGGLLSGCRSVPPPQAAPVGNGYPKSFLETHGNQTVYVHFPRRVYHFGTGQKLNALWWFGNADEPVPPPWYRPGKRSRTFLWHLRNPCHNFTFFVMGIGDKPFLRVGKHPANVASPEGGWNVAVCQYKCLRLPFVDYALGRFEFYCGWRNGGNFGMKFNFGHVPAKSPATGEKLSKEKVTGA